ncbi:LOW QUALITY PROTEIN: high affinity immunoglobulin alpha and immunoglobulin mu Fc receptor [Dipodomys merriami]|uniref:LOW QUALITY PROTEIN: high affinity immunoglobulin alpha and immunoglobulin mu Fc receptor n=1 Tax=Dipodomys merriami TaxID=94247 RepID=UPI003855DED7
MDAEAPAEPRERKVTNQSTGWKMILVLILCLLQGSSSAPSHKDLHLRWWRAGSLPSKTHLCAVDTFPSSSPFWADKHSYADVLKGPRLVSGEAGGAVIIQCHYTPLPVNRHQRKYWCRLGPPRWICHTIVSTNYYTHHKYLGRVALADFPRSCFFEVRLSRLSLDDTGHYRCGIGNRNNLLFLSMNLIISAGPSNTAPTTPPAPGKLITASFGTASPGTPGPPQTQEEEEEGSECDRIAPSAETSKTQRRQSPGTDREVAPEMHSQAEGSIKTTVPTVESPALNHRGLSSTPEDAWTQSTGRSVTNEIRITQSEPQMTTTQANWPGEGTERVRMALGTARKTTETTRPSALMSAQAPWDILRETLVVSQQQALGSMEGSTLAPGTWTLETPHLDAASVKGSTDQNLDSTTVGYGGLQGDSSSQATLSQALATDRLRPTGKGASMKSAFPDEESSSWILTPGSTMLALFLLVALVLIRRKIWRKRTSQEAEKAPRVTLIQMTHLLEVNPQPKQLFHVQRKALHDFPPIQASLTIQEKDPGP